MNRSAVPSTVIFPLGAIVVGEKQSPSTVIFPLGAIVVCEKKSCVLFGALTEEPLHHLYLLYCTVMTESCVFFFAFRMWDREREGGNQTRG